MFWDKTWHVEDLPNKNHSALCGLWTGGKPSLYTLLDRKKKEFFLPPLRPHPPISSLCADGAPPLLPIYCIWTETGTWASCAILSTTCMQDKILIKRLILRSHAIFSFTITGLTQSPSHQSCIFQEHTGQVIVCRTCPRLSSNKPDVNTNQRNTTALA